MSYDSNIYSHPEKHGLRIFGELNDGGGYDFDMFVVWEGAATGALYYSADSGCSCPSPFEYVNTVADLTVLDDSMESWAAFQEALDSWKGAANSEADELAVKASSHLSKVADTRRRGAEYVSAGAYRDAVARAEAAEKRAEATSKLYQDCYTKLNASQLAHRRLSAMLNSLGNEIALYMSTEAPQRNDVTYKVQTTRTAETGE